MWDYAFIIPRRTSWWLSCHQAMSLPGIGPEGGEMSLRFLFMAVCVMLKGCLDGIGRLRDILVRVSMRFQLFLSHIIYTFTYICVCIILYTCIISIYMIHQCIYDWDSRPIMLMKISYKNAGSDLEHCACKLFSINNLVQKKQNTDRCFNRVVRRCR